ncbi:hypothetical protein KAU88_07900 [Candidatus Bathyarchaeota archaeon]|nr:hypothetical protein [Candidatus Bathyarchaeota archaeon]
MSQVPTTSEIKAAYGARRGDPRYKEYLDIDKSGKIDMYDMVVAAGKPPTTKEELEARYGVSTDIPTGSMILSVTKRDELEEVVAKAQKKEATIFDVVAVAAKPERTTFYDITFQPPTVKEPALPKSITEQVLDFFTGWQHKEQEEQFEKMMRGEGFSPLEWERVKTGAASGKFAARAFGSGESFVYTVATIAGVKGLGKPPVVASGAAISALLGDPSGLEEVKEWHPLEIAGSLYGDILVGKGISKVVGTAWSGAKWAGKKTVVATKTVGAKAYKYVAEPAFKIAKTSPMYEWGVSVKPYIPSAAKTFPFYEMGKAVRPYVSTVVRTSPFYIAGKESYLLGKQVKWVTQAKMAGFKATASRVAPELWETSPFYPFYEAGKRGYSIAKEAKMLMSNVYLPSAKKGAVSLLKTSPFYEMGEAAAYYAPKTFKTFPFYEMGKAVYGVGKERYLYFKAATVPQIKQFGGKVTQLFKASPMWETGEAVYSIGKEAKLAFKVVGVPQLQQYGVGLKQLVKTSPMYEMGATVKEFLPKAVKTSPMYEWHGVAADFFKEYKYGIQIQAWRIHYVPSAPSRGLIGVVPKKGLFTPSKATVDLMSSLGVVTPSGKGMALIVKQTTMQVTKQTGKRLSLIGAASVLGVKTIPPRQKPKRKAKTVIMTIPKQYPILYPKEFPRIYGKELAALKLKPYPTDIQAITVGQVPKSLLTTSEVLGLGSLGKQAQKQFLKQSSLLKQLETQLLKQEQIQPQIQVQLQKQLMKQSQLQPQLWGFSFRQELLKPKRKRRDDLFGEWFKRTHKMATAGQIAKVFGFSVPKPRKKKKRKTKKVKKTKRRRARKR